METTKRMNLSPEEVALVEKHRARNAHVLAWNEAMDAADKFWLEQLSTKRTIDYASFKHAAEEVAALSAKVNRKEVR